MRDLNAFKLKDQLEAAAKLAEILPKKELNDQKSLIICGSLDSVILADLLSQELNLSYDILFSEPITAPNNPECEIAIVSETEDIVLNDELIKAFNISYDYIYGEAHRRYEEKILKNIYKFRKGNLISELKGRNILLVDDGCETGLRAGVCIKTLANLKAKSIIYATPLIASNVALSLSDITDEIYAVEKIVDFISVDEYYENKIEATSERIVSILEDSSHYLPLQKQQGEKTGAV